MLIQLTFNEETSQIIITITYNKLYLLNDFNCEKKKLKTKSIKNNRIKDVLYGNIELSNCQSK